MADGSLPIPTLTSASFCTGIGGWEVATEVLGGFEHLFFSEIEPFPSAVLAHHWPEVSNFGDLTAMDCTWWRGRIDVVWGSCPCQAFSFAGRRRGLKDKRGGLTLAFVERVEEIDPTYVLYENVKGILSDKSNAFGCLLGALAGADGPLVPPGGGKKWSRSGYVLGPKRTVAWRLQDAQHGGVPQRRERVFVVGSAPGWADPREILFECEGERRDTAPRRRAGAEIAAPLTGGARESGGWSEDDRPLIPVAFGGMNTSGPIDVATAVTAGGGGGQPRYDFDTDTFLVSSVPGLADTVTAEYGSNCGANGGDCAPLRNAIIHSVDLTNVRMGDISTCVDAGQDRGNRGVGVVCATGDITHALKGEGADASEDGTGRGNPIIAFSASDDGCDAADGASPTLRARGSLGANQTGHGNVAVAYSMMPQNSGKDFKAREVDVLQPLMAGGPVTGNQGGDVIVQALAVALRGRAESSQIELGDEVANALRDGSAGGGSRALALIIEWGEAIQARVRRLTPLECERLQGLPDNHTQIPWGRLPAELCPDGPRYKTIGNGLAIPDVRWIAMRLQHFHALKLRELERAA